MALIYERWLDRKNLDETAWLEARRNGIGGSDAAAGGGAYDTDGLWKPTKEGLGMAHCIDEINKVYGANFIRY